MTLIRQWVKKYELYGVEGLEKKLIPTYDGDFKKNVVEYMHANHLSAIQTSIQFNLGNPSVVLKWERIYYEEGPHALYIERRGMAKKMDSIKQNKKKNVNENEDLLKENQYLRMENEYLKKLNALVQERIKRENKKK